MADMILVEPFALTYGGATPSIVTSRGTGGAALLTKDPREVWQDVGSGSATFSIDLGADTTWDTIALINTNGLPAATLGVTSGTAASGSYSQTDLRAISEPLRLPSEDLADARGPALFFSASPIVSRFVRVTLQQAAGGAALQVGSFVMGRSWAPSLPREFGGGRPPLDTGVRTRLDDGGLVTVSGSLLSGFSWVFADLDDADLKKLWGIIRRRRTTEPVLLVEDPAAGEAEGVHYGTFVGLEKYERREPGKSRWALTCEDWV